MNRRTALKNVLFISAGTALLPACMQQDKATLQLSKLTITGSQEKMMADLVAAIIPATKDFIGAADVKAHEFTLMMMNDCESPDMQQKYLDGMKQFEKLVKDKYNKDFSELDAKQKNELLTQLDKDKNPSEELAKFYNATKYYTVQAFATSAKYMTDVRKYKMVPGSNFKGCVPVGA